MAPPERRGTLILVVGPSGAGKDTLIAGARTELEPTGHYYFPRRVITRAADAGGETHVAVDAAEFKAMKEQGAFALSWNSHSLSYGVPVDIESALAGGRHVVVNLSRSEIANAEKQFPRVAVIVVTAPLEQLRQRLIARGREGAEDVEERLSSSAETGPALRTFRLSNTGTIEHGIALMLGAIRTLAGEP